MTRRWRGVDSKPRSLEMGCGLMLRRVASLTAPVPQRDPPLREGPSLRMPSQEKRQQVSTEHQDRRESDNHQRDVVEFPWAVGAAIENNRDNEDEHTTRERDVR